MESMTLEGSTTPTAPGSGCQPFADRGRGGSSGSSPEDEGGRRGRGQEHLSIPLPPLPPPPASTQASSSVAQGGSSEGEQKRAVHHSSSTSSTSSTSSSPSTPSSSKHRDRKHDR